jgi:hypothetical protein
LNAPPWAINFVTYVEETDQKNASQLRDRNRINKTLPVNKMCLRDFEENIIKIDVEDIGKNVKFVGDCLLLSNSPPPPP